MTDIPPYLFSKVQAAFNSFDTDRTGQLSEQEAVQNNQKRAENGQNSLFHVEADMDINKFYDKNKSIFLKEYGSYEYYELAVESQYREADNDGNNEISPKEAEDIKPIMHALVSQYKPQQGETLEDYKSRVMPQIQGYIQSKGIYAEVLKNSAFWNGTVEPELPKTEVEKFLDEITEQNFKKAQEYMRNCQFGL